MVDSTFSSLQSFLTEQHVDDYCVTSEQLYLHKVLSAWRQYLDNKRLKKLH